VPAHLVAERTEGNVGKVLGRNIGIEIGSRGIGMTRVEIVERKVEVRIVLTGDLHAIVKARRIPRKRHGL
jgi:50S ribosomal subunit-associated GTPase HflX